MLCGGTPYALTVTTDRPADVRIYSVAEDGRVMGGWAHRVDGEWSATPAPAAVQLPGGTRYRVVAVAVAPGASFGGAPPMGCMTPRGVGLPPKRLPADAALAAITYGVWAPGDGECPRDPAAKRTHDQLLAAITGAPTCPDRR